MPEPRSCSCGGFNDRCCFCYGSGVSPLRPAATSTTIGKLAHSKRLQRKSLAKSKPSSAGGNFQGIAQELRRSQADQSSGTQLSQNRVPAQIGKTRLMQRVNPAGGKLRQDKDFKKFEREHSQGAIPKMHRKQIASLLTCPLCERKLNQLIIEHNRIVRKGASLVPLHQRASDQQCKERRLNPSPVPKVENDSSQWQSTDLMDAHRGLGAHYRERGRFGSHPIHDRFDGESKP